MSAEDILNQPSETVERAPAAEYVPMGDAYAPPSEPEKVWDGPSDVDNVRAAADERIRKKRDESEPVERTYIDYATGEPMPMNQTLDLNRAADDLTRQRNFEAEEVEKVTNAVTAIQTDAERLGVTPERLLEQQYGQQQAQPEIQPQPVSDLPPEVAELGAELDRSPKLKAALIEEVQRIRQREEGAFAAEQQFTAATSQAHSFAIQSMLAAIPELQGISVDQLPAALQVLRQSNPQRHADAVQHLARVDQLGKAAAAAQQQQQQRVQAHVQQWTQAQDAEVDAYLAKNESVETVRAVKDNLPKVLQAYGVDLNEFKQAIAQTPVLRSAPFQKMLFQLSKQFVLQEQVAAKAARPVPPVQRPGTSQPRSSYADAEVAAARERFLKNPDDLRVAAAYLTAKRNARS